MNLFKHVKEANIPPLYTFEDTKPEYVPVAIKLFTPYSNWSWYITEAEVIPAEDTLDGLEDIRMFGYVKGHTNEFGYVSLRELQNVKHPVLGDLIEVDLHFDLGNDVKQFME